MEPQVVLVCVAFILCASYILRYRAHANTILVLLLFDLFVLMEVFLLVTKLSDCGHALLFEYMFLLANGCLCLHWIHIAATALHDAQMHKLNAIPAKTKSKDAIDDSAADAKSIMQEPAFDVTTRLNRTHTKDEISAKKPFDNPLFDVTARSTRTDMTDETNNIAKKPLDQPPANVTQDKTHDIAKKPPVEPQPAKVTRETTDNVAKKPSNQPTTNVTQDKADNMAKKPSDEPPADMTTEKTNYVAKKPSVELQPANVTREKADNMAKKPSDEPPADMTTEKTNYPANGTREKADNITKNPSDDPPTDFTIEKTNNIAKQTSNNPPSDVPACSDRTDAKDNISDCAASALSSEQASSGDHPPKRLSKTLSKEPPSDVAAHPNRTDTTDKITTSTKEPVKEPPSKINSSGANASLGKQAVSGSQPFEALSKKPPSDLTASPVRREKINDSTAHALLGQQPSPASHPHKQPSDKLPSDITAIPDHTATEGLSTTEQMVGVPQTSVAADCLPSLRAKVVENKDPVEITHKKNDSGAQPVQRLKTAVSVEDCSNTAVEESRTKAPSDAEGHPNKSAKEWAALAAHVGVIVRSELRADQPHLELVDVVRRITLKCQMYALFGYDTSKRDVDQRADSEKQYELREALMGVLLDESVMDGKDDLLTQLLPGYKKMWLLVLYWFADFPSASVLSKLPRKVTEDTADYQLRHTMPFHLAMTYLLVSTLLCETAVGWKIVGAKPDIGESYGAKFETYGKLRLERLSGGNKAGESSSIDRLPNTGGGDGLPVVPGVGIGERDSSKAGPDADGKGDEKKFWLTRGAVRGCESM
ncbi:hypothetical protein LTR12_016046 [Friedmanniomyces endolithicus]|nr:hypothetical protein LTR12_016046 [Friedmanniomyces endolithicus]